MFPTHLDVIERMRKIKNLNNPMPFSPKLPPPELRNFQTAYGKQSSTLEKRIDQRKCHVDYILPQEPISMDAFLKRIKECPAALYAFFYYQRPDSCLRVAVLISINLSATTTLDDAGGGGGGSVRNILFLMTALGSSLS